MVITAAEYDALRECEQIVRDCRDYFTGFDMERTDGVVSPIIERIDYALAKVSRSGR